MRSWPTVYKSALLALLLVLCLWLFRWVINGDSPLYYSFMVWNVFLAFIPLLLVPLFRKANKLHGSFRIVTLAVLSISWLLFLPNAFYVLTDFMHLNGNVLVNQRNDASSYLLTYARGDALFLFDSLLVFVGTVISSWAGGLALLQATNQLRQRFSSRVTYAIIGAIMVLVGVGVYIGRYARWNSWDGLLRPWAVVGDLLTSLGDAVVRERMIIVVVTMVLLQVLSVWAVKRFSGDTADQH